MFEVLEKIANAKYDGHFTVMKFTSNWRVSFGYTPSERELVQKMAVGKTFEEAALNAIIEEMKYTKL